MRKRGQRIKRGERRALKREFLRQYQTSVVVSEICRSIGLARCTFYAWLKRDVQFAARYFAMRNAREEAKAAEIEHSIAEIQREYAAYWQKLAVYAQLRVENCMARRPGHKR